MTQRIRILHLEDSPLDQELAHSLLAKEGFDCDITLAVDRGSFERALEEGSYDLILSDFDLKGFDGFTALHIARERRPGLPFILLSGTVGEDLAVTCLQKGATDYIMKTRLQRLSHAVARALQDAEDHRRRLDAESALRRSLEQQRALLEAARVVRVAPWSLQDGRLVTGASFRDLLGFDPASQGGGIEALLACLHPEDLGLVKRMLELPGPRVRSLEARMRRSDGAWLWTRWTLEVAGQAAGIIQDIAEQRRLQDQLTQSQKMEGLGTLAAGLAHDLKNLLQAVGSHAELMERDPALGPRSQGHIQSILMAVDRGRELTSKLLAFSRQEPPKKVPFKPSQLLEEVAALVAPTLGHDIHIGLDTAPGLPQAQADVHQLHQVLVNMVLNAKAAMKGAGSITLRSGSHLLTEEGAYASLRPPGEYIYLEVEDTGSGIAPEDLPRIFEPFFTTKGEGGTGLGLSVAYGIVEAHGGWIECRSVLGQGTSFRILLPTARNRSDHPSGPLRVVC